MGAAMFTAARALLPTPCPTITPSAILYKAENMSPMSVGTNNFENNCGMSVFPKSMLSLSLLFISF